ncbi:MAG: flagellar motor switch phosphatase FliY [Christensenellales bacterium]|jgi:flagellar motor switch protein FliN/FliY
MREVEASADLMHDMWRLSEDEIDALGEIGNICMGASATAVSSLLSRRVSITTPRVRVCTSPRQLNTYKKPYVVVEVMYTAGVIGYNAFLLKQEDAYAITDLLMGGEGSDNPSDEVKEMYMSAISEVMNQMVGSSSTSLAGLLGKTINISPPEVREIVMDTDDPDIRVLRDQVFIQISFSMEIEGLLSSDLMQVLPFDFGRKLARGLLGDAMNEEAAAEMARQQQEPQTPDIKEEEEKNAEAVETIPPAPKAPPAPREAERTVPGSNMDLVMDIPLSVVVELGQAKKSIRETMELKMGSVIVLDKNEGEDVEVIINDKLIARGKVVVVNDNYGVKISEVISQQ